MSASNHILLFSVLLLITAACSSKREAPSPGGGAAHFQTASALGTEGCGDPATACGAWCFQVCSDTCHGAGAPDDCAQALGYQHNAGSVESCLHCTQGIQRWSPVCAAPATVPSCPVVDPGAGLFSFDSVDHLDDGQDAGADPIRPTFPDGGDVFSTLTAPYLLAQVSGGAQLIWTNGSDGVSTTEYSGFAFQADASGAGSLNFLLSRFATENQFDCTQPYTSITYADGLGNSYYAALSQTDTTCSISLVHRSTGAGDPDELTFSAHLSSFLDGSFIDLTNGLIALPH